MLLSTGWIDRSKRNEITDEMWDRGRNHCSRYDQKCLKSTYSIPRKYTNVGGVLNDTFVPILMTRDPMDRLVSAWRDKIYRREERRRFYVIQNS